MFVEVRLGSTARRSRAGTADASGTAHAAPKPKEKPLIWGMPSRPFDQDDAVLPPCCQFCQERYYRQQRYSDVVGLPEVSRCHMLVVATGDLCRLILLCVDVVVLMHVFAL